LLACFLLLLLLKAFFASLCTCSIPLCDFLHSPLTQTHGENEQQQKLFLFHFPKAPEFFKWQFFAAQSSEKGSLLFNLKNDFLKPIQ